MYVLDTNTVIDFLKGQGRVAERFLATDRQEIGLPTIVAYELEVGVRKTDARKRQAQLTELLETLTLLPFGAREATEAAALRVDLESRGLPIGPHDVLIAATALAANAILVTRNTREFERVDGLRVETWF